MKEVLPKRTYPFKIKAIPSGALTSQRNTTPHSPAVAKISEQSDGSATQ